MTEEASKPAPKSRHGCLRCKRKRMKCDETKPACRRCSEKQLNCPGYHFILRWSRKHEIPRQSLQRKVRHSAAPKTGIEAADQARQGLPPGTIDDTQAVNTPSLHGLNDDFLYDDAFWNSFDQDEPDRPLGSLATDFTQMSSTYLDVDDFISPPGRGDVHIGDTIEHQPAGIARKQCEASIPDDFGLIEARHIRSGDVGVSAVTTLPPTKRAFGEVASRGASMNTQNSQGQIMHLSIPQTIRNPADILVPYFFQTIIPLYSCFDSDFSSIRLLCRRLWQSSEPLFHVMQSMAATTLKANFSQLGVVAGNEYRDAGESLQKSTDISGSNRENVLALILVGQTASWHSPTDLARHYFLAAREAINQAYRAGDKDSNFFIPAMDYWRMLLAFLTDEVEIPAINEGNGPSPAHSLPHPFSGTACTMVRTLSRIGSLIFRYKKTISATIFMAESDVRAFRRALAEGQHLEESLLLYRAKETWWMSTGDDTTTLSDLEKIDEAYRCVGLLQLYRVFPDLLIRRYRPWSVDDLLNPPEPLGTPTPQQRNTWLTQLALHTLEILQSINFESRTRCVQPFLLVAVSSELRLADSGSSVQIEADFSSLAIQVASARQFIRQKLSAYSHILPLPKVRMIYDLVNAIWDEMDAGRANVYWLEVALRKNMATLMG